MSSCLQYLLVGWLDATQININNLHADLVSKITLRMLVRPPYILPRQD